MKKSYSQRLKEQLETYKKRAHPDVPDGTWRTRKGEDKPHGYILHEHSFQENILPTIREQFWRWLATKALKRHKYFHHLNSSQAMAFNLFFPLMPDGERVDQRLLAALAVPADRQYLGEFEKILDPVEETNFDFYMQEANKSEGRQLFFELKLSESKFGSCNNDCEHEKKLQSRYRPDLEGHVDAKWLEPATFFANYQIMRNLSYLGRCEDSGVVFIFPKANEQLRKGGDVIKQIVSKSLAPRVEILYLEYLIEKILAVVADDAALTEHYLAFRDKYVCL